MSLAVDETQFGIQDLRAIEVERLEPPTDPGSVVDNFSDQPPERQNGDHEVHENTTPGWEDLSEEDQARLWRDPLFLDTRAAVTGGWLSSEAGSSLDIGAPHKIEEVSFGRYKEEKAALQDDPAFVRVYEKQRLARAQEYFAAEPSSDKAQEFARNFSGKQDARGLLLDHAGEPKWRPSDVILFDQADEDIIWSAAYNQHVVTQASRRTGLRGLRSREVTEQDSEARRSGWRGALGALATRVSGVVAGLRHRQPSPPSEASQPVAERERRVGRLDRVGRAAAVLALTATSLFSTSPGSRASAAPVRPAAPAALARHDHLSHQRVEPPQPQHMEIVADADSALWDDVAQTLEQQGLPRDQATTRIRWAAQELAARGHDVVTLDPGTPMERFVINGTDVPAELADLLEDTEAFSI